MSLRVYIAAPYADAPMVRDVHRRMLGLGLSPTSSWATSANGKESPEPAIMARAIAQNDADVERSNAMLVLSRDGAGAEMYCEARYALTLNIPVVWVGRRALSAYRQGVQIAEDLDHALQLLVEMARRSA